MARQFPEYRFVAGQGAPRLSGDSMRNCGAGIATPNLEMPGLINRFHGTERMHDCSTPGGTGARPFMRDCQVPTFLEAAAYGCPIISRVDPDQFATKFGQQVHDDDYAGAIRRLLADAPLERGGRRTSTCATYETSAALNAHVAQYDHHACTRGRAA
ncbi:MAG: hypothetical protein U0231_09335 [Nitrospiraceae bacterium]